MLGYRVFRKILWDNWDNTLATSRLRSLVEHEYPFIKTPNHFCPKFGTRYRVLQLPLRKLDRQLRGVVFGDRGLLWKWSLGLSSQDLGLGLWNVGSSAFFCWGWIWHLSLLRRNGNSRNLSILWNFGALYRAWEMGLCSKRTTRSLREYFLHNIVLSKARIVHNAALNRI